MVVINVQLLKQGYRYHKLTEAFSKFYRRHHELVSNFSVGLKSLVLKGLSEPEFYGDLVYKFKNDMGRTDFSDQFRKIIIRHKRISYDLNVTRQSACLVIYPITVDNFVAYLIARRWIGCKTIMAPTLSYIQLAGTGALSSLIGSTGVQLMISFLVGKQVSPSARQHVVSVESSSLLPHSTKACFLFTVITH